MDYGASKIIELEKRDLELATSLCQTEQDGDTRHSSSPSLPDDDRSCALTLATHQLTFTSLLRSDASEQQLVSFNALSALSSHVTSGVPSPQPTPATGKKCVVCEEEARGKFFGALVCLPCKTFFIRCSTEGVTSFKCRRDGQCDVTGFNRSRCKACRYRRCTEVGMMRRERPEQVEVLEGQQLCTVCGDVANGVHFGVVSCEGCKKFFRRGLSEYESYECKHNGLCVINPRRRNDCRYCRYQKCLQVGMSRVAIKMGRPRKYSTQSGGSSGEHDDLGDLQLGDSELPENCLSPLVTAADGQLVSDSHSRSLLDINQHVAPAGMPSLVHLNPSVVQAKSLEPSTHSLTANNLRKPVAYDQQTLAQLALYQQPAPAYDLTSFQYDKEPLKYRSSQNHRYHPYQLYTRHHQLQQAVSNPWSSVEPTPTVRLPTLAADEKVEAVPERMLAEELSHVASYWQATAAQDVPAAVDEEDRLLTHRVLEAYYAFSYDFSRLHSEQLLSGQALISNPEQRILSQMVHVLNFIKSLPSFSKLCSEDSYNIARLVSMQVALLQAALGLYDEATHSLPASFLPVDLPPDHPLNHFRQAVLDFVRSFRFLKLDDTEAALLHGLLIFATDFSNLQQPDFIEVVRAPLMRALFAHTTVKYGPNNKRVSEMFSFMPCLRQLGLWYFHLTFTMPVTAL